MTAVLRPSDAVGRLGGDEFAVLLPGAAGAETAVLAGRLRAALAETAPASLGAASFPADGDSADALHQLADLDLYAVKHGRSSRRPAAGAAALSWAATLARAVDARVAIRHEHSTNGLAGEDIPLEARVLAVADAFDAMTTDRPYRPAMDVDAALAELRRCAGSQIDPACVELLAEALAPPLAARA
jgi:hypothetical protein